MRHLLLASMLLMCSAVHGAVPGPFAFSGWVDEAIQMQYMPTPTSIQGLFFPGYLDVTGNDATGELTINRWEFYNDARTSVFYSIPPQTLSLTLDPSGTTFSSYFNDVNDPLARIRLRSRPPTVGTNWDLTAFFKDDYFINAQLLASFPQYTHWEYTFASADAPEPASMAMMAIAGVGVIALRRQRKA